MNPRIYALGLLIASNAQAQTPPLIDSEPVKAAMAHISDKMKDPESVRFRKLHYVVASNTLCGQINAKNSYGAYSGYEDFFVAGTFSLTRNETPYFPELFELTFTKCMATGHEVEGAIDNPPP